MNNQQIEQTPINLALINLQIIIQGSPKSSKSKKVNHLEEVVIIKNCLTQVQSCFLVAGMTEHAEAAKLLLQSVERALGPNGNVSATHGLDYSRIRKFAQQLMPQVSLVPMGSKFH